MIDSLERSRPDPKQKIDVTQEHINSAQKLRARFLEQATKHGWDYRALSEHQGPKGYERCKTCAVAQAVSVYFKEVTVTTKFVSFRFWGYKRFKKLPKEVAATVHNADVGVEIRPFSFDLSLFFE